MSDDDVSAIWSDVGVTVEFAEGEGDWAGLTLVTAAASTVVSGEDVNVSLSRYILMENEP
jgi:hypothetical protein